MTGSGFISYSRIQLIVIIFSRTLAAPAAGGMVFSFAFAFFFLSFCDHNQATSIIDQFYQRSNNKHYQYSSINTTRDQITNSTCTVRSILPEIKLFKAIQYKLIDSNRDQITNITSTVRSMPPEIQLLKTT